MLMNKLRGGKKKQKKNRMTVRINGEINNGINNNERESEQRVVYFFLYPPEKIYNCLQLDDNDMHKLSRAYHLQETQNIPGKRLGQSARIHHN